MLGRTETAIQAPVLLCLIFAAISSANILTDIPTSNPLNIDWDPAPSPEDGPPLSAEASRNKALLPAQIGGIVGAYFVAVCVVGLALILIGRRLRYKVQYCPKVLDIEMIEPRYQAYGLDPSPVSPRRTAPLQDAPWPFPEKDPGNPYIFPASLYHTPPASPPGGTGDPYVDHRVVEADRDMLQRDLEDIYAHVMEQEDAKANGVSPKDMPPPPQLQYVTPVPTPAPRQGSPPKKSEKSRPANISVTELKSPKSHSRVSSIISSLKSPRRKTVREMQISSPMLTPASASFPQELAEGEDSHSTRYYTPPPPPPIPKDQIPFTPSREIAAGVPLPSSPRSLTGQLSPRAPQFHRPNPSQTSIQSSSTRGDHASTNSATSQTRLFIPLQPQSKGTANPPSNNSSVRTLPFRQFETALQSPSFAPSTKTTVLERSGPVGGAGPQTGGLRTPWSAGAVPYSPYQPFSPLMPISPRLVTKEERKAMKKAEGRTPVLELIKSDDEMWS